MISLRAQTEDWPLAQVFRISRASKHLAQVVMVTLEQDGYQGHGECLPYPRYDESPESVIDQIESLRPALEAGLDRAGLQNALQPGAARNALDCAMIDLECKQHKIRAWDLLDVPTPRKVTTAYTLSMEPASVMAENARKHAHRDLLKLKLGPNDATDCVQAVRDGAPNSRLIVDANEAWTISELDDAMPVFSACGVEMVEQPLPSNADKDLQGQNYPVPIGADESCHTSANVDELANRYQVLNIKLDKNGGTNGSNRNAT